MVDLFEPTAETSAHHALAPEETSAWQPSSEDLADPAAWRWVVQLGGAVPSVKGLIERYWFVGLGAQYVLALQSLVFSGSV